MKIQTGWYAVLGAKEVKNRPIEVRRFGVDFVVWRDKHKRPVIQRNRCAHRSAKLSLGKIKGDCIQCPYHGIEYDNQGNCQLVPETKKAIPSLHIQTFHSIEQNEFIWMWMGEGLPVGTPHWFENITDDWVYSELSEQWKIHFSRWVENEMDMVHLPFVHHNTIGKGKDPSDKTHFEFSELSMIMDFNYGNFGSRIKDFAEFRYPNIWQLGVSQDMFLMMAFAPVGEEETKLYFRTYRRFGKLPVVRNIVNFGMNQFNGKVVSQDKEVVLSQPPYNTAYEDNESLSLEDTAIRHFREILKLSKPFGGLKIDIP